MAGMHGSVGHDHIKPQGINDRYEKRRRGCRHVRTVLWSFQLLAVNRTIPWLRTSQDENFHLERTALIALPEIPFIPIPVCLMHAFSHGCLPNTKQN